MPAKTKLGVGDDTVPELDVTQGSVPPPEAGDHAPVRGDTIGRFVVLGWLGAGGMGVVYSAYDPQLDRKVAIKLLRATIATADDARARLLREAQAMAKIDHPNVIKVHEVGTFGDRVYVAMELAEVGTLGAWLAAAPRSRHEILGLFIQAGRGLAAAHAAGLVHRDFKPENVLIAKDGRVRVTDFGLVSSLADVPSLAPDTVPDRSVTPLSQHLTRTGAIMGTPSYMAPEQFDGGASARSDQFAFCVALYEALYGGRPFAGSSYSELVTKVLLGEIRDAPKGSHVPSWLRRVLLRGLTVDPNGRFPSMAELLAALGQDPVRRRWQGLAIAAALLGLAAGGAAFVMRSTDRCSGGDERVATLWNPRRRAAMETAFEASQRPHAAASFARSTTLLDSWSEQWQAGYLGACRDTRDRGAQSEQLLDLRMACLTRRLDEARATLDLLIAGGGDAVDHALDALRSLPELAPCADPVGLRAAIAPPETPAAVLEIAAIRARLDQARGDRRLVRYSQALAIARPALVAARATGYLPVVFEAEFVVGQLQESMGDRASIATFDDALHVAVEAGDGPGSVQVAAFLIEILATESTRFDAATEIASLADAIARRTHAPPAAVASLEVSIASLLQARAKPTEARVHGERALALAEHELGPDHEVTQRALRGLATLDKAMGRFADARAMLERVVASAERIAGKDHPMVAAALSELGNIYRIEGKLDDAKRVYERALAIRIAALGLAHPEVGTSFSNLGTLYGDRGDLVLAQSYDERALAVWEAAYGKDTVQTTTALINLASVLVDRDKPDEARKLDERALAILEAAHGPDHPSLVTPLTNLATVELSQDEPAKAYALYERALRIHERVYGADQPDDVEALSNLVITLKKQHKLDEAEAMSQRVIRVIEKAYGADHVRMAIALVNLGGLQSERHHFADALASNQRALAIIEARLGKDHLYVCYAGGGIALALIELGRPREARPVAERALALGIAKAVAPTIIAQLHFILARALVGAGDHARARREATAALVGYEQAKDPIDAAPIRPWLAAHP